MKALVDTNVWLDVALDRRPFADDAEGAVGICLLDGIEMVVASTSLKDVFYLVSKLANAEKAYDAVRCILEVATIGSVDRPVCESAFSLEKPDFGDGIVAVVALAEQCDVIISRDASTFGSLPARRLSPAEFIKDRGYESLSISELLDEACGEMEAPARHGKRTMPRSRTEALAESIRETTFPVDPAFFGGKDDDELLEEAFREADAPREEGQV